MGGRGFNLFVVHSFGAELCDGCHSANALSPNERLHSGSF